VVEYVIETDSNGLKHIVETEKQKAVAYLDGLIREQEASKKQRESKTKIDNPMLVDFFVRNPEELKKSQWTIWLNCRWF